MKHFIPLESDPETFTELLHNLGASTSLKFVDVISIDDPLQLALIPRPVLALILIFPTSKAYEVQKKEEEATEENYNGHSGEEVIWIKQTINNACGLYGILHASCNIDRSEHIESGSILSNLIARAPLDRTTFLENSETLSTAYNKAAQQGSNPPPAEDEVDFHYVCLVKSRSGTLYELDGDRSGPLKRGILSEEDILTGPGLDVVRKYIERENGEDLNFSLLALVSSPDE